jgi:hypothetical protein
LAGCRRRRRRASFGAAWTAWRCMRRRLHDRAV